MNGKSKQQSIGNRLLRYSQILTVVLAVPAVISLVMMLASGLIYHNTLISMERVAQLQPVIKTDIPEAVWYAVAGRTSFEEGQIWQMVNKTAAELDAMIQNDESEGLDLTIARRTMDTMTGYISQIETQIDNRMPVVELENMVEEVRSVGALVESILQDYINGSIGRAAGVNSYLRTMTMVIAGLEVLLIVVVSVSAQRTRKRFMTILLRPIKNIEAFTAHVAGGDFSARRLPAAEVTELAPLTEQINSMADRLESLFDQIKQEQGNLRKAELRTLQAQINPHFLYNTLDAIVWQAEEGRNDEVIRTTRALSDFFRISLSSGDDWIPVAQELQHLSGYLQIQRTRYRDILRYEINVDEDLHSCIILKLLLQPLVENALYHGIKFKRGGGTIRVEGHRDGETIVFSVSDTGRGMTPERLKAVVDSMHGDSPPLSAEFAEGGSGFGLRNVDQRIKLYYSQPDGLHIESGSGGTTVTFRVPIRQKGDRDDG